MKKILITTGGTGGHVIPAQIIKDHLEDEFEVFFSTDFRGLKYLSTNSNRTVLIDTPKFNLSFYLPFRILKLIFLVFKSLILLKKKDKKNHFDWWIHVFTCNNFSYNIKVTYFPCRAKFSSR